MTGAEILQMATDTNRHWKLELRNDIAWLTLDVAGQSANTLGREVLEEFDKLLAELETKTLKGLIIRSAKKSGFIAGADVREFEHITDPVLAAELARTGQRIYRRLAALPYPTVVAIHGFCVGGGLSFRSPAPTASCAMTRQRVWVCRK
jgi:3-hydroxyacyl-CoA dehydrogenase / enoyl-CoA hydratase / 3-hydroxybutyryl-CoA epimerase